jgi:hypothetical protein
VNKALGREGMPMLMLRDDRYAVAVADAFSRITAGTRIGVCTLQLGVNAADMQYACAGLARTGDCHRCPIWKRFVSGDGHRRAPAANASGRPAYFVFVRCQYPVNGQWVGRSSE